MGEGGGCRTDRGDHEVPLEGVQVEWAAWNR